MAGVKVVDQVAGVQVVLDQATRAQVLERGSRSGKHPDPPEHTATYRAQEKASREKI